VLLYAYIKIKSRHKTILLSVMTLLPRNHPVHLRRLVLVSFWFCRFYLQMKRRFRFRSLGFALGVASIDKVIHKKCRPVFFSGFRGRRGVFIILIIFKYTVYRLRFSIFRSVDDQSHVLVLRCKLNTYVIREVLGLYIFTPKHFQLFIVNLVSRLSSIRMCQTLLMSPSTSIKKSLNVK
jgi:hypothetical protein